MFRQFHRLLPLLAAMALPMGMAGAEVLRGVVTDTLGGVIPGAMVQVQAAGRSVGLGSTTATGEFAVALADGAAGGGDEYTITAMASGFAPASRALRLADAAGGKLALVLEIAPYRQAVEIRTSLPLQESLLDMSGVRESAARDLGEAMTAIDGVSKIRKGGIANDLVVRGFQQNNIAVLVDGSRTYGACPSHMDPPAQHVDFAEVDHVEVTKGAFDVANQGSMGALVNIVTKEPGLGFSLKPSLSMGSYGFYNPSLTASWGNRRFRVLGGYSFRVSDPYRDGSGRQFTDYGGYSANGRQNDAYSIHTGWTNARISLSDRQEIALGYTRQQAGLILYPYLTMDGDYDNADRATARYTARDLGAVRSLRLETYFTQVGHYMTNSLRAMAPGGVWTMASDAGTRTIGGRAEADLRGGLTAGVESYSRNWNLDGFMRTGGVLSSGHPIPDVQTRSSGAYVNYTRALTERLRFTGGARYDHAMMRVGLAQAPTTLYYQFHDTRRLSNADNYGSVNASLSMKVVAGVEAFAGVGTNGRIPDASERYFSRGMGANPFVGNPLLAASRNTEATAGANLTRDRFYLRPSLFYSWIDNYILVIDQLRINPGAMGAPAAARSYGSVPARIRGGELSYGATLSRSVSFNGGASYSRGTAIPAAGANVNSRNLPEMPPLKSWAALRYSRAWFFAEMGATAAGRQSKVDGDLNEAPTPGYAVMDVKLGFTRGRAAVSFTLDNLFNRFYYESLSYYRDPFSAGVKVPEPGRNAFMQVRYSF